MKVCVIPARGGSKRIPRKNIKNFCGKPIIAWSIEAALGCKCFDEVIVSTDDRDISAVAVEYGASAPFARPCELSGDHTATIAVIRHAIQWYGISGVKLEAVCCLYPTAPTVDARDIALGAEVLCERSADFVISVTSFSYPVQRALRLADGGNLEMLNPAMFQARSQDLDIVWHDAGQFCWGKPDAWLSRDSVFGVGTYPVFIPHYRAQDIDTPDDWKRAEAIFKALRSSS